MILRSRHILIFLFLLSLGMGCSENLETSSSARSAGTIAPDTPTELLDEEELTTEEELITEEEELAEEEAKIVQPTVVGGAFLVGSTRDEKGNPLVGAEVYVRGDPNTTVRTDGSGNFNVPVSGKAMDFEKDSVSFVATYNQDSKNLAIISNPILKSQVLGLSAGLTAQNVELVLKGTGTLKGNVPDAAMEKIDQPELAIPGTHFKVSISSKGFELQNVPEGTFEFVVSEVNEQEEAPKYKVEAVIEAAEETVVEEESFEEINEEAPKPDTIPPTISEKNLIITGLTSQGFSVSKTTATDEITTAEKLLYKLVKANNSEAIDSIEEIEALDTSDVLQDWIATLEPVNSQTPSASFFINVAVKDEAGNISIYNPLSVQLLPDAPSNFVFTPGIGQIDISFTASVGATSYKVYYATSNAVSKESPSISCTSGSSCLADSLTVNTTYYLAVSAINAAGESILSDVSAPVTTDAPLLVFNSAADWVDMNWSLDKDIWYVYDTNSNYMVKVPLAPFNTITKEAAFEVTDSAFQTDAASCFDFQHFNAETTNHAIFYRCTVDSHQHKYFTPGDQITTAELSMIGLTLNTGDSGSGLKTDRPINWNSTSSRFEFGNLYAIGKKSGANQLRRLDQGYPSGSDTFVQILGNVGTDNSSNSFRIFSTQGTSNLYFTLDVLLLSNFEFRAMSNPSSAAYSIGKGASQHVANADGILWDTNKLPWKHASFPTEIRVSDVINTGTGMVDVGSTWNMWTQVIAPNAYPESASTHFYFLVEYNSNTGLKLYKTPYGSNPTPTLVQTYNTPPEISGTSVLTMKKRFYNQGGADEKVLIIYQDKIYTWDIFGDNSLTVVQDLSTL